MNNRLANKNIIVTTARQDIGKTTTFHNEGANVTAIDLNEKTFTTGNTFSVDGGMTI